MYRPTLAMLKSILYVVFFQNDPLLRDLDTHVTLEEVNSMIALEYGQAMVVNIRRVDNEIVRKYF